MMRLIVASLFLVGVSAGIPHDAPELPDGWSVLNDPVPHDHLVELRFSLKQTNLDQLFEVAKRVSDPQSSSYGQYRTRSQIAELTAPRAEHVAAVEGWLIAAGLRFEKVFDGVVALAVDAATAGSLMNTTFNRVGNSATGQQVVQASKYELPDAVDDAIVAVYGMHGLPLPPRISQMPPPHAAFQGAPAKVTPAVILQTYDVSGVVPTGSDKNRQAVTEFQGQSIEPSDLSKFFHNFVPNASEPSSSTIHKFVPSSGVGRSGIEAALDIEYIMGVAPGVLTEFWYWKGMDFCGDLQQWTSTILSTDNAPLVHSVSYGWQGKLEQLGCMKTKVDDIDANFAKLAAKGITIIFASGDSGSGYAGETVLYPSWPASSPWVTAVGSTRFQDQIVGHAEMATDQFGSGSGFSSMFNAFDAQATVVKNYLKIASKLPPTGSFPPGGRATPDVAALGEGFQVLAGGMLQSVGGTSASTPTFAGLVSLLNEARLKAGKPAMGHLNPWLYQHPEAFTDITVGSDAIGRGGQSFGKYGFECAKGWDPVTGLGTPIFSKMLKAALSVVGGGAPEEVIV